MFEVTQKKYFFQVFSSFKSNFEIWFVLFQICIICIFNLLLKDKANFKSDCEVAFSKWNLCISQIIFDFLKEVTKGFLTYIQRYIFIQRYNSYSYKFNLLCFAKFRDQQINEVIQKFINMQACSFEVNFNQPCLAAIMMKS